jgi:hypothetical protein
MAENEDVAVRAGMVISVRTRQDVIVVDPDRFLATARRAYLAENEGVSDQDARAAVADVYDAVCALIDRYGSLVSDHPEVAVGASEAQRMHGGVGLVPSDRVTDRPDGLSPAGEIRTIVLQGPTLQSYGCFLPDDLDTLFQIPPDEPRSLE